MKYHFNLILKFLLSGGLLVLFSFSNSFEISLVVILIILFVSAISGWYFRRKLQTGFYLYLLPCSAILFYGLYSNYYSLWPIEFIALYAGYYSIPILRNHNNIGIRLSVVVAVGFCIYSAYSIKYDELYEMSNEISYVGQFDLNPVNATNSEEPYDAAFYLFSSKYCGLCKKQIRDLNKISFGDLKIKITIVHVGDLMEDEENTVLVYRQLLPDLEHSVVFDSTKTIAQKHQVMGFPVLFIQSGKNQMRINGHGGDLSLIFEERILDAINRAPTKD